MPAWLIAVIAVDVIVTGVFLWLFLRRRAELVGNLVRTQKDFGGLMRFAREQQPRIAEYLRANWSGSATTLPAALQSLLAELEASARASGLELDREMLLSVLATSVRHQKLAPHRDLEEAMRQIA